MARLKLRKIGNSLGIVLPKEVVSRLQAQEGSELFLAESPDGSFRISPFDPSFEEKMSKVQDIMSRYRNTLHVLAK